MTTQISFITELLAALAKHTPCHTENTVHVKKRQAKPELVLSSGQMYRY